MMTAGVVARASRAARMLGAMALKTAAEGAPDDVLVLAYHAVSDAWDAETTVTVAQLRAQLEHLVARGYRGATFEQAVMSPPPGRVLAVTFDDAHRSVMTVAFPLLRELGLPGTVFAPTDWIGAGRPTDWAGFERDAAGPHAHELVCMDWDELAALADAGWEVGSHTCSHPHLTRLPDGQLRDELERSRAAIEERLGRPCRTLAYPYSDHDGRVVAATAAAGYVAAATIPMGGAQPYPLRWPRVGVFRHDSPRRFRLLTTPLVRQCLATTVGDAIADVPRAVKARWRRRR